MIRALRRPLAVVLVAVILAGAAFACGSSKDATAICEKANTRWTACMTEMMGAGAAAQQKTDIAGCASDEKTVAMYRECLPKETCDAFTTCMFAFVEKTN